MRTQDEILQRIKEIKDNDAFGFQTSDYLEYLDYEHAKEFLKQKTTKEEWEEATVEVKSPKEQMIEYMPFAWEKANNKRGISSYRSMEHYTAWLWLDGDEELHKTLEDYEYYGKPQLIKICEYLGIDSNQWDDGIRENE